MKSSSVHRAARWILSFFASFFVVVVLCTLRVPPLMILAVIVLVLILPGFLVAYLWRQVAASGKALQAKNYVDAKRHARHFLSCMPWLRWLKPLMRFYGNTSRDPEAMALNNLGAAALHLREYDMARQHLEAAMRREGSAAMPHFNMGLLTLETGDFEGAKPWFDRATVLGYSRPAMDERLANYEKWAGQISHVPVTAGPEGVPFFQVRMYNDEKTPMDFIVFILQRIFSLPYVRSKELMLEVHHKGRGICGTYGQAEAESKVAVVQALAAQNGFPLVCEAIPAG